MHPLTARRLALFKKNRRGWYSLWIFAVLCAVVMAADFIANDRPLVIQYQQQWYWPLWQDYPESTFGGSLIGLTDYRDRFIQEEIQRHGFAIWPLIPFHYRTVNYDLPTAAPSPPTAQNWLGTDDQGRDVLTRLLYGLRVSILFAFTLTLLVTVVGLLLGALQGYYGGLTDLLGQRLIEIWSGLPTLYLLIILSSLVEPNFWWLLLLTALFGWTGLAGLVRAEFLRGRALDYVRAAKALGVGDSMIMWRHILPNAMVATLTLAPFMIVGGVGTLTALDFLGFGLPPGSASLGELFTQAKNNLSAPWLVLTAFFSTAIILSLLMFIGEALRDAFDPRRVLDDVTG